MPVYDYSRGPVGRGGVYHYGPQRESRQESWDPLRSVERIIAETRESLELGEDPLGPHESLVANLEAIGALVHPEERAAAKREAEGRHARQVARRIGGTRESTSDTRTAGERLLAATPNIAVSVCVDQAEAGAMRRGASPAEARRIVGQMVAEGVTRAQLLTYAQTGRRS